MIEKLVAAVLEVQAPLAYLLVFLFAVCEGPLLLGFIVPGELAVIVGGALVSYGNADFVPMSAASAGAILGDSTGYWMGTWIGPWFLRTRFGDWLERRYFCTAQRYLRKRGAAAVIIGRFTAALRVILPGVCGMTHMPYPKFFLANVVGGVLWGVSMVALGFVAGTAWERASRVAGAASAGLLIAIVAALVIARVVREVRIRRRHDHPR